MSCQVPNFTDALIISITASFNIPFKEVVAMALATDQTLAVLTGGDYSIVKYDLRSGRSVGYSVPLRANVVDISGVSLAGDYCIAVLFG